MTVEAMKNALATLEDIFGKNRVDVGVINELRQSISQPEVIYTKRDSEGLVIISPESQPDCRGCKNLETVEGDDDWEHYCAHPCTNGDKFQALPKVVLYKVTP